VGSTITEKILAAHAGVDKVKPGELITAKVDLTLSTDVGFPLTVRYLEAAGVREVWDPERIALVPGRYTPNKDLKTANQAQVMRRFAREHQITHYFEVGELGIDPVFLPEQGLVGPGDLVAGNNSHTCTMGALGALAVGMGATDVAAIMALGETWFLVPESIKIEYWGELGPYVTSKDLILWTLAGSSVHRLLHQRKDHRFGPGRQLTERKEGREGAAGHRHARHAPGVPGSSAGRVRGGPRCRRCDLHDAHLWGLCGTPHGCAGERGSVPVYQQPELRGTHGQP